MDFYNVVFHHDTYTDILLVAYAMSKAYMDPYNDKMLGLHYLNVPCRQCLHCLCPRPGYDTEIAKDGIINYWDTFMQSMNYQYSRREQYN